LEIWRVMSRIEEKVRSLLETAGIEINGRGNADIRVNNPGFYKRVLQSGSLGLGESYMDGWWECEQLDEFIYKVLKARLEEKIDFTFWLQILKSRFINIQNKAGSKKVVEKHYDLSPELYMSFLDPYNQYTCGYFKDTNDLNRAQEQKLDLICKKLMLSANDKVLDIGCGWGGFAKFASENYKCHVTGITNSEEQVKYANEFCKNLPVTLIKSDYRDIKGEFDKILVCGMIEHVGYKNYKYFMRIVHDSLKEDGLFLLQTIGRNNSLVTSDPWVDKYIFPNSMTPSIKQIGASIEDLFVMEDWHSFGAHYEKTLKAWFENFDHSWDRIKAKYDERFYRMWKYYLLSFAGSFRARTNQLWQIVLSKRGIPGGYKSSRLF
jgi:cyclopropane-fatty-acyl-phospholipid synthase